jgi:phosphatidylethanolamine/phosphatidyl-N-methylethanolamine N-methyltransferase
MRMDASSLQFPDASFDAVLAPYVMSVVSDPRRVLSEMKRVCRPSGRIVIVNHFLSRNPLKDSLEKALTPLSIHMGFRLDTPVGSVLDDPDLVLEVERRVNLFGNWTLLRLRRTPTHS